jgi:hypothetical protein
VKAKEIMKLTESAEIVTWPETHYVFLEKTGPIPKNAPLAWQEFLPFVPQLKATTSVTGFLSVSMGALRFRPHVDCWDFVYAGGCLDEVKCEVM